MNTTRSIAVDFSGCEFLLHKDASIPRGCYNPLSDAYQRAQLDYEKEKARALANARVEIDRVRRENPGALMSTPRFHTASGLNFTGATW